MITIQNIDFQNQKYIHTCIDTIIKFDSIIEVYAMKLNVQYFGDFIYILMITIQNIDFWNQS